MSLVSLLSRREIEEYYEDVSLPIVDRNRIDGVKEISVRLEFEGKTLEDIIRFEVRLIDTGVHTTLDIRCH